MKRICIAFSLLALLCLAGCGEKDDYPTVTLPEGMTIEKMGEGLLELSEDPYRVVKVEPSVESRGRLTDEYRIVSSQDDSQGYIFITSRDGALLQAQISINFDWDTSYVDALTDPASIFGLLSAMEGTTGWAEFDNSLIYTKAGDRMIQMVFLQLLADIGFDEALRAETKEKLLDTNWSDNEGLTEIFLGGCTLKRIFAAPEEDTAGGINFFVYSGDRTSN